MKFLKILVFLVVGFLATTAFSQERTRELLKEYSVTGPSVFNSLEECSVSVKNGKFSFYKPRIVLGAKKASAEAEKQGWAETPLSDEGIAVCTDMPVATPNVGRRWAALNPKDMGWRDQEGKIRALVECGNVIYEARAILPDRTDRSAEKASAGKQKPKVTPTDKNDGKEEASWYTRTYTVKIPGETIVVHSPCNNCGGYSGYSGYNMMPGWFWFNSSPTYGSSHVTTTTFVAPSRGSVVNTSPPVVQQPRMIINTH